MCGCNNFEYVVSVSFEMVFTDDDIGSMSKISSTIENLNFDSMVKNRHMIKNRLVVANANKVFQTVTQEISSNNITNNNIQKHRFWPTCGDLRKDPTEQCDAAQGCTTKCKIE